MDGTKFDFIGRSVRIPDKEDGPKKAGADPCPDASTFASYLDDKLETAERDTIETHMAGCPACRNDFYEIRMMMAQTEPAAPETLADTVKHNLQTHDGASTPGRKIKV